MNLKSVSIKTAGIKLVLLDMSFKEDIFREFTADIIKYLSVQNPPKHVTDTENFIINFQSQYKKGEATVFAITTLEGEFLGCTGIHKLKTATPMVGLWVKESAQGNGHGKAALLGLMDWARKNIEYEYITYDVDINNTSSIRLIESLVGTKRYESKEELEKKLDLVQYRIK